MREQLQGLAHRRGAAASVALVRPTSTKADSEPQERYLHTTVHITEDQQAALRAEAAARVQDKRARRIDASAVARDVIDFWRENQTAFIAWMEARKSR